MLVRVHKITKRGNVVDRFSLIGTEADIHIGKYETRVDTVGGTLKLTPLSVYESSKKVRIVCKDFVYTFYKFEERSGFYDTH